MKLKNILVINVALACLSISTAYGGQDFTDEWRSSVTNATMYENTPTYIQQQAVHQRKSKWRSSVNMRGNVPNFRIERASKNHTGRESKVNIVKSSTQLGAKYKGAFDIGVKRTVSGFKVDLDKGW